MRLSSPTRGSLLLRGGRLAALPVLFLLLVLTACGGLNATAKKVIVSANDIQDGAKNAYNEAVATTAPVAKECGVKAKAAVPPVTPSFEACALLGVPLPYDPVKLNTLVGPINATYETIRGAEAARLAWNDGKGTGAKADVIVQVTKALEAVTRFITACNDVGLKVDTAALPAIVGKWNGVK